MAQIPRTLPVASPTNVSSTRLPGGLRTTGSTDARPVEGVNPQEMVLFNEALLYQEKEPTNNPRHEQSRNGPPLEYAGSTQAFAAMFEEGHSPSVAPKPRGSRPRGYTTIVARAINTYENNVRVVQGLANQRGEHVSMTL